MSFPLHPATIRCRRRVGRRWMVFAIAAASIALEFSPSVAQSTGALVTDRPDFTESTVSVGRGMLQIEAGYTFARGGGISNHSLGEILFRLGIGGPIEFRAGLNSYVVSKGPLDTQDGFEDTSIGLKLEIREADGAAPAIGLISSLSLPTGAAAFTSDAYEPELILAFGWEPAAAWTLGSNIGFLGGDVGSGADNQWIGSAVIGRAAGDRAAVFGEIYGFSNGAADADLFLDGGLTLGLNDDLQLDVRLARQIGGTLRETHVGIGIARRWRLIR